MQISKEYIELIKALTAINPSVLIARDNNSNTIRHLNVTKDIFYELTAPKESFDFSGEYIAFFAFQEFHDLFSAFPNVSITEIGDNKLKIDDVDTGDAFTYTTHDRMYIKGTYKNIAEVPADFKFVLNDKTRDNIRKKAGLISADQIRIESLAEADHADGIRVTMINSKSKNVFAFVIPANEENQGHIENEQGERTEISVLFPAQVINKLPAGDYAVDISSQGLISFFLKTDGISLSIRSSAIDDGI